MPRLTITDFNTPEFYGKSGNVPGGYGNYQPIHIQINPQYYSGVDNDSWYGKAQRFIDRGSLIGRKVIELGCAWGSLTRYLRQLGANAYGLDLAYSINQGIALWPEMEPYLIIADARAWIITQAKNSWDAIISRGFLECQSDADLATLIPEMNRVAKFVQIHSTDTVAELEYYNVKTLAQWQALPFEAGTILVDE